MRVHTAIPVLATADLPAAVTEFVDVLGFAVDFLWDGPPAYAGLERDGVEIHLRAVPGAPAIGRVALVVDDIDAVNADLIGRGARIDVPLAARPYGLRDLSVLTRDGHTLSFGADA